MILRPTAECWRGGWDHTKNRLRSRSSYKSAISRCCTRLSRCCGNTDSVISLTFRFSRTRLRDGRYGRRVPPFLSRFQAATTLRAKSIGPTLCIHSLSTVTQRTSTFDVRGQQARSQSRSSLLETCFIALKPPVTKLCRSNACIRDLQRLAITLSSPLSFQFILTMAPHGVVLNPC